jgi:glycosyltransferase involved in cell wall biosynthesis
MAAPLFSLITPVYNRQHSIRRAVDSCLRQTFGDFELIVVDDASTDETGDVVAGYADPRVRLVQHDTNRGPCPARNSAIARARGEWCVMVDSDFELHDHALERLSARIARADDALGNIASSCVWDTGAVSPAPGLPLTRFDHSGYLGWIEELTISEKLDCVRRRVFDDVRFPDSRAWEFEFHLNLSRRWDIEISDEVLVTVFTDQANRLTHAAGAPAVRRVLEDAGDKFTSFRSSLEGHGAALAAHAPRLHAYTLALTAHNAFLTGRRREGLRFITAALRRNPRAISWWGTAAAGLLGRTATAWATVLRRQRSSE